MYLDFGPGRGRGLVVGCSVSGVSKIAKLELKLRTFAIIKTRFAKKFGTKIRCDDKNHPGDIISGVAGWG